MIRLIGTLGMLFLSMAYAQDNNIHRIQQTYLNKLRQLKLIGNDQVGYYPLCSALTNLYLQEKQAILQELQKSTLLPQEHRMIQIEVGFNEEEEQRQIALGQEEDVSLIHNMRSSSLYNKYNNCFTGNTPVTTFYTETISHGWNDYENKRVFRTIELQEMYEHREETQFHVLSSSIGKIENAPSEYHKDCWASVNQVYLGHVADGQKMITFATGRNSEQYHFEVTPQHRFYAYLEGECSENSLYVWQEAQNLRDTDMRLYQGEGGQLCPINYTSQYTVDGGLLNVPKQVYNLNTSTHAYYVGPKANQVLVHDTKLINE